MQVEEEEEAEAVGRRFVFSPIRIALVQFDVDDRYEIADANTPFKYWFPQNVDTYAARLRDCMNVGQRDRTPLIRWIIYGTLLQIFWINNTMRRSGWSILFGNRKNIFYSLYVDFKTENVNGAQWICYNYTFYVVNVNIQYRWTRHAMLVCPLLILIFIIFFAYFFVICQVPIEWNNGARCSHNYSNGNGLKWNLTIVLLAFHFFLYCARARCMLATSIHSCTKWIKFPFRNIKIEIAHRKHIGRNFVFVHFSHTIKLNAVSL